MLSLWWWPQGIKQSREREKIEQKYLKKIVLKIKFNCFFFHILHGKRTENVAFKNKSSKGRSHSSKSDVKNMPTYV